MAHQFVIIIVAHNLIDAKSSESAVTRAEKHAHVLSMTD